MIGVLGLNDVSVKIRGRHHDFFSVGNELGICLFLFACRNIGLCYIGALFLVYVYNTLGAGVRGRNAGGLQDSG